MAAILVAQCVAAGIAFGQDSETEAGGKCSVYAAVPLPAETEKAAVPKESPACASYKSYRGIGRPVNYAEARACAWKERAAQKADLGQNGKEPTAWVVGGSLILADIYYNGAGVKRDVPLGMRFACEEDKQMAESAMEEIAKQRIPSSPKQRFEFCDYAWTTFMANFCTDYKSEIADDRRAREYERLKASMSPEQKATFDRLLASENAYIDMHSWEVDQEGTIRVIRTLGSQKILNDLFHAEVLQFKRKTWPAISEKRIVGANALLDHEYAKAVERIGAEPKDEVEMGAVTAEGLSKAEAVWEAYRDAWVEFARVCYPAKAAGVGAEITLDRYRLVKTIP